MGASALLTNVNKAARQIHRWLSIVLALPMLAMFAAGVLLMLKKEIDWIQPVTSPGVASGMSASGKFEH